MFRWFVPLGFGFFTFIFIATSAAYACMGISRTINVNTFNAHMGEAPSASIGLRNKEVVLTFDDGPNGATTPRVLSTLAGECLKATFFVVGEMARSNPKLLQKVARGGHTIAHHTHDHKNLTHLSLSEAQRNIATGVASVRRALGPYKSRSSKLFRYPYLSRSTALDRVLRRSNLLPVSASIMSQDWRPGSANSVVERVMSKLSQTGRGIILLHDIQTRTAVGLPRLLRRLKQGGYKIVHLRSGGGPTRGPQIASLSAKSKKDRKSLSKVKLNKRRKSTVLKVAKTGNARTIWSLLSLRTGAKNPVDGITTGSVKKRVRKKKRTGSKKSTRSKRSTRSKTRASSNTKAGFSFFNKTRRRPKESKAQYQARLRVRRIRLNKKKRLPEASR